MQQNLNHINKVANENSLEGERESELASGIANDKLDSYLLLLCAIEALLTSFSYALLHSSESISEK